MSPHPARFLAVAALAAMILAGCSTSPASRIEQNRALYESWPIEMQEAVLDGRVVKGMTPDMVKMALGAPTRIEARSGGNSGDEIWIYQKGGGSGLNLPLPSVSVGGSIGGVGVMTGGRRGGSSRSPVSGDEQDVVFQNGVVLRVD